MKKQSIFWFVYSIIIKIRNIFFQGDLHVIKHSVILYGIPLMKENLHILDTPLTTYLLHLVDIFFGWHFKGFFDLNDCLWSYIENSKFVSNFSFSSISKPINRSRKDFCSLPSQFWKEVSSIQLFRGVKRCKILGVLMTSFTWHLHSILKQ